MASLLQGSSQMSGPSTGASRIVRDVMFGAMFIFLASCFFSIAINSLSLGLMGTLLIALMLLERRFLIRATPLDWFFLAYVIAEYLSTVFSYRPLQSLEFSKRLLLIGIVYWFASWITTRNQAKIVMAVLLGTAAAVAALGVVRVIVDHPLRLGIFQFYMTTSELMMFTALMALPFAIHPGTPKGVRIASLAVQVPILISLYATVTKGAYLAFGAGVVVIAVIRNKRLLLPLMALVVLVVVFAPPFVRDRLSGIVDINHPENAGRLRLWSTGWRIVEAHPLIGVGDADLHDIYVRYMDPGDPAQHGHLHNMALQFLATLGIVGFCVVAAMFVRIAQVEWRAYKVAKDDWLLGSIALGALAVFTGLQVAGLTEWTFGDQEVVIVFWITVGMSIAAGSLSGSRANT